MQTEAIKDTYIDSGAPGSNYGGSYYFYVGNYSGNWRETYLAFDTTNPPVGWNKAEIWIYFEYLPASFSMNISLVTQAWVENTLTWSNKPAYGISIAQVLVEDLWIIYKVDVTDFISGNSISVCLNASDTSQTTFGQGNAREDVYTPSAHLVWTYPEDASITVTDPNSSINWMAGRSLTIEWTSIGNIFDVCIQLYKGDQFLLNFTASAPNDGSYLTSIGLHAFSAGNDYRVKISDADDANIYGFSEPFSIVSMVVPGYDVWLIIGFIFGTVALVALNIGRKINSGRISPRK